MIKEFKDFIAKGNVMDMAVGIIIGAAFTAIVGSLVSDLINPIIAIFTGGIDFSGWFYSLDGETYASLAAAQEAGVDFTMADIDRLSRKVPNICKVAPATQKYHMEDVQVFYN